MDPRTKRWLERQKRLDNEARERADNKRLREAEIDPVDPDAKRLNTGNAIVPFTGNPTEPEAMEGVEGPSDGGETTLALRAGASSSANQGAHETPVMPHYAEIGFPETYTTIIPDTIYLSVNDLDAIGSGTDDLNKIEIRLNSPYSPMVNSGDLVSQTDNTAVATGVSVNMMPNADTQPAAGSTAGVLEFPYTFTTSHKAKWLKWWEQMYDVYHVMETHYEVTIAHARSGASEHIAIECLYEQDQYGATSSGNRMPAANYHEMINWPRIKSVRIDGIGTGNANKLPFINKIVGTWRPGQNSHNTTNDGDIKTWNTTGAVPDPVYVESLHMRFFRSPLNNFAQTTASGTLGANVQIKLYYKVQFKDLKQQFRYPRTADVAANTIDLVAPTDILQTA